MQLHKGTITFEFEAERDPWGDLKVTGIWFPEDLNPKDLMFKGTFSWLRYETMEDFILANLAGIYVTETMSLWNIIDEETPQSVVLIHNGNE